MLAALLALSGQGALAGNVTWTGGGSGANWSTGQNWNPTSGPAATSTLYFNNNTQTTNNNDEANGTSYVSLNFASGTSTGQFVIGGNSVILTGGGSSNPVINNLSNYLQTVNFAIDFTSPSSSPNINGGAYGLTLGGALTGTTGTSASFNSASSSTGTVTLEGGAGTSSASFNPITVSYGTLALDGGAYYFQGNTSTSYIANGSGNNASLTIANNGSTTTSATFYKLFVGNGGTGSITQSSGSLTVSSSFNIGEISTGTYTLNGGTLSAAVLNTGASTSGNGTFTITNGTAAIGGTSYVADGASSTGAWDIEGGTVDMTGTSLIYLTNGASGSSGTLSLTGGTLGFYRIDNTAGATGTLDLDGGILQDYTTGGQIDTTVTTVVQSAGALIDLNSNSFPFLSAMTHDSTLGSTKDGGLTVSNTGAGASATLTLSAANTFTGDTVINGGTINVTNALALQDSTLNYNNQGGTITFGTGSSFTAATLGGMEGAESLALKNVGGTGLALSVGNNNTNTTYSGGFTSTGSLNKIGSGTLTLTGPSSYSGGTTVTGGVLLADNATSSVGSGAVSVTSTGVLGGTGVINTSGVTSGKAVDIAGELAPTDAATGFSHLSFTLAGTSTLTLEAGSTFAFNLGADVNSSDEVVITGGKLVLTSLDYSNFTFNAQSNFGGAGTYILFAVSVGITGSPNADNSGTLDGGAYNGQIMVSGNNLDLVVTSAPEPGTWVMLVSGLAFLVMRNRRKGRLNEGGRA